MEKQKPCLFPLNKIFSLFWVLLFITGFFSKTIAIGTGYLTQIIPNDPSYHDVDFDLAASGIQPFTISAGTRWTVIKIALNIDASAAPVFQPDFILWESGGQVELKDPGNNVDIENSGSTIITNVTWLNDLNMQVFTLQLNHTVRAGGSIPANEAWHMGIMNKDTAPRTFFIGIGNSNSTNNTTALTQATADASIPRIDLSKVGTVAGNFDFSEVLINSLPVSQLFTICNIGTGPLEIRDIYGSTPNFVNNTTIPFIIAPVNSTDAEIAFIPPSTPGEYITPSEQLIVENSDPVYGMKNFPLKAIAEKVEIALTLDISGSMGWQPDGTGGDIAAGAYPPAERRLSRLKEAATNFAELLWAHGTDNGAYGAPADAGIVVFPGLTGSNLYDVDLNMTNVNLSGKNAIQSHIGLTNISGLPIGNWHGTPMGEALKTSAGIFTGGNYIKRNILLFSDGAHNTGIHPQDISIIGNCPPINPPTTLGLIQNNNIKIYAFGYGTSGSSNVNHTLLSELSDCAGNSGNIYADPGTGTATPKTLTSRFESILFDMGILGSISDPLVEIKAGENIIHKIPVTEYDHHISFSVTWEPNLEGTLNIQVKTPDGTQLDSTMAPNVYIAEQQTWKIISVNSDFLSESNKIGEWQLIVTYINDRNRNKTENYNYSVLTNSRLKMDVGLDKNIPFTGDKITFEVASKEGAFPSLNNQVILNIEHPEKGFGDWFAEHEVSRESLEKVPALKAGEQLNLLERKSYYLRVMKGIAPPAVSINPGIKLYDDGVHGGDKIKNDGIYTNSVTVNTPGVYSFTVNISGETKEGNKFQRSAVVQKYVDIAPDTEQSDKDGSIEKENKDGSGIIQVSVTPVDQAKNYLGPGYANKIKIKSKDAEPIESTEDLLNGTYLQKFELKDLSQDPNIVINVRGVNLFDGPFSELTGFSHWGLSAHLGYTVPHGTFDNYYNGGLSWMLDAGYYFNKSWAAELLIGNHSFANDNEQADNGEDFYLYQLSLNGKYNFLSGSFNFFTNAGIGLYFPKSGNSSIGMNIGSGVIYSINADWYSDLRYNYHKLLNQGKEEFSTINIGVRFMF